MDDVANAQSENELNRKIRGRLLQWESKENALAALNVHQEEYLETLTNLWQEPESIPKTPEATGGIASGSTQATDETPALASASFHELQQLPAGIDNTNDFLLWYDRVHAEIHQHADGVYHKYLQQLELRSDECCHTLEQIDLAMQKLQTLNSEYDFVSNKTSSLNSASEKLIEEQQKLQQLGDEIQRRLHFFNQVELLHQRLQSPTLSVASEAFRECLNRIDECLGFLNANVSEQQVDITQFL